MFGGNVLLILHELVIVFLVVVPSGNISLQKLSRTKAKQLWVGGERGWNLAKVAVRVSSFRVQRRSVGRDGCFTNRINNISSGSSSSSFVVVVCHQAGENRWCQCRPESLAGSVVLHENGKILCLGLIRKLSGISTGIRCIVLTVYGWANRSICGRWKLFTHFAISSLKIDFVGKTN